MTIRYIGGLSMRLTYIIVGLISEVLLLTFIFFLKKQKNALRTEISKIFISAWFAVLANVVVAYAHSEFISNVAFSVYYSTIDFIAFFLLTYTFTYTGRDRHLGEFKAFWRIAICVDAINMMISIFTGHMYSIYSAALSDGTVYYKTVPSSFFNVHLALCYLPIVFSLILLSISLARSHGFYRFKFIPILLSVTGIVILNILYMMFSLPYDFSVLFYAVASFLLFFFSLHFVPRRLMSNTLQLATDFMKEGIFLFDAEQNIIFINKTAAKAFDISDNHITFSDHPISAWLEGMDSSNLEDFQKIYPMHIHGKDMMVKVDYKNCKNSHNHHMGSFFLFEDVTADQILLKNLESAQTEANQANVAKSLFLANMSHEIRTPINSILGMNEMILRECSDEHILEYAGDIAKSGDTLLTLINNILDFSKIESGKMEIRPEEYNLFDLIRECYHLVAPRAMQKDLPLEINCEEDMPSEFLGDSARIKQVLVNLLTNSIKYTNYGKVSFNVFWRAMDDNEGVLKFVVSDTGQGISEADISRLFRVFQRVDEDRNRAIEGTGLGLAISKQLMSMMDGDITVNSTQGKGSVFTVSLPQKIVNATPSGKFVLQKLEAPKRSAYKEAFHAPDAKVLVVDDIEMNLKLMNALLKKTGLKITTAISGTEAAELCQKEDFDLILMDHMMPPPDGYETMKIIRDAGGHNAEIPIIVLTANAVEGAEKTYMSMGFDGYLSKPVLSKDLEAALIKFLPDDKIKET